MKNIDKLIDSVLEGVNPDKVISTEEYDSSYGIVSVKQSANQYDVYLISNNLLKRIATDHGLKKNDVRSLNQKRMGELEDDIAEFKYKTVSSDPDVSAIRDKYGIDYMNVYDVIRD